MIVGTCSWGVTGRLTKTEGMEATARHYKYPHPQRLSVPWLSLNVTQNYLNKGKSEDSAAGVAATGAVTLTLKGLVGDRESSCLFSLFIFRSCFFFFFFFLTLQLPC